ncbi:hypothetical protein [Pelobacter propionicus]|uniref:hypothetical protein n=1 Tax=Pelobacter propionicus TaxID=29543 RepID=UPI00059F5B5D|nr:hypothetical protein [Pelobacter propionicus]
MKFVIKVDITDPLTVKALEQTRKGRKMARLVTDALSHYLRTKDGQASIEIMSKGISPDPSPKREKSAAKKEAPVTKENRKLNIDDFLSFTPD